MQQHNYLPCEALLPLARLLLAVEENEKLKADNWRLRKGSHDHSSSLESPAHAGSQAHSASGSENSNRREPPRKSAAHDAAFLHDEGMRSDAAAAAENGGGADPLRALAGIQDRMNIPGSAAGPSGQIREDVLGCGPVLQLLQDRGRRSSPAGASEDDSRALRESPDYGQAMALLGSASGGHGRNALELMPPPEVQQLAADVDMRKLAGNLSQVLDMLEPLRAVVPILERLPAALGVLDVLPKIQEMAARANQVSSQNKVSHRHQ